jgi:DNA-binding protein H-NS
MRVLIDTEGMYRDPKTGETWSGRGRMANWLKTKQDAGEDIDDYLV